VTTIDVISTLITNKFDLIFGIEKNPNEEDQYNAVVVMYPPHSIREAYEGKKLKVIGRYVVETGSLDEISKYKEIGVFSEWPFFRIFRTFYLTNGQLRPFDEPTDRDLKFGVWLGKMLEKHALEMETGHTKKKWWKRLLGIK